MEDHNEHGWTFAYDMSLQELSKAIITFDVSSKHGHEHLYFIKDKKRLE